jgi:photosystem II stability/assembly factor-like uncharacterized protein
MAVHPHKAETIYVVPEVSPYERYVHGGGLGVWKSTSGGKSWRKLTRGLPQENVYAQVLRHSATTDSCDDAGVYVGTTSGEIYHSRDGGDSWALLQAHLSPILSLETALV